MPHASIPRLRSFPTRRSSDLTAARKPRQAFLSSSLNIPIANTLTRFADYDIDWLAQNSTTHCSAQKRSFPPSLEMKARSEEHTSELQSRLHLVCRLLLEKKNK